MVDSSRSGRSVVPGPIVTGRTLVPGQVHAVGAGLDKMLEVVGDSPNPGAPQAFLLVVSGAEPGRLHVLERPEMVIGRSRYADIRISERAMSQQHAKLVRIGDHHRIYDLGSTNGTYVNDQRIEQADLKVGDVVQTGETVFTYMSSAASTETQPPHADSTIALPPGQARAQRASSSANSLVLRGGALARPAAPLPQVIESPYAATPDGPDVLGLLLKGLDFFRRYWLSVFLFTLLGGAAGIASYKLMKPPATATFEIELIAKPSDNPLERQQRLNFEFFRSAQQSFVRPSLIAETLKEMGESDITPDRIRAVQEKLTLTRSRMSQNIYLGSYQSSSADEALAFLRLHLDRYLASEIDKALRVLIVEVDTLKKQLAEAEQELNATEQAILAFKEENSEGLPDQAQEFYRELIGLGTDRGRAASEVARAAAELELSRKRLKSESPLIESRIEQARPYEEAIADLKQKLAAERAGGKGNQHPMIIELQAQLRKMEELRDEVMAQGTQRITREKNPIYESARRAHDDAEAALKIAQAELARLTNDFKRTESIVNDLPRLQQEYSELTRSYDATKSIHAALFEKLTSSQLQLNTERGAASARYDVLTPVNVKSASAIKTMVMRGGALAVLGFFFGICLGLLRDLRRLVSARLAAMR